MVVRLLTSFFVFISLASAGQICIPQGVVHFDSNKSITDKKEEAKLQELIDSLNETGTYIFELYGHADQMGFSDKNIVLSENRARFVETYIRKHFKGTIEALEIVAKGDLAPVYDNAPEEKRVLNRRVEIMVFQVKEGRIALKNEQGVELLLDKEHFKPCNICDSKPEIISAFTPEEAAEVGMSLRTTDGSSLITGGMFQFDFDCEEAKKRPCKPILVSIPSKNPDPEMTVWNGVDSPQGLLWEPSEDSMNVEQNYNFRITSCRCPCKRNADKVFPGYVLDGPYNLMQNSKLRLKFGVDNIFYSLLNEDDSTFVAINSKMKKDSINQIDLQHVYDSVGFRYETKDKLEAFQVAGSYYNYVIPDSAYSKSAIISDTIAVVKVPRKYVDYLNARVAETDEEWALTQYKKSKRKFQFKLPEPETELVLHKPDGWLFVKPISEAKTCYNKRKKVLKVKIKRKELK